MRAAHPVETAGYLATPPDPAEYVAAMGIEGNQRCLEGVALPLQ